MEKNNNQTESIRESKLEPTEEISTSIIEDLQKIPRGSAGFVVIKGPNIGDKFFLSKDEIPIGRNPESDIFLDDITVSRKHAVLKKTDQGFKITDYESLNGTYVNGNRVDDLMLKNGDRIQIGKYVFLYFSL
ncbi:MAG: FHA domain-containing protein [Actinomycetota bacterium]